MSETRIRVGIIGNGFQARYHHWTYIKEQRSQDVQICWGSGCSCLPHEIDNCPLEKAELVSRCEPGAHLDTWKQLLPEQKVDAIIVSTPNGTHAGIIRQALELGIHVAVDKPPTISSAECKELTELAKRKNCIFLTISQRRYEDVYQKMAKRMASGDLGEIRLIQYFTSHSFGPARWRRMKSLSGGGIFVDSAFHGIDTILWLLKQLPNQNKIEPVRVSADWILDTLESDRAERVELIGSLRLIMSNGCIFNVSASYENPSGSIDETIKIFGKSGALRYLREELEKPDPKTMSAGKLTFQKSDGKWALDHDGNSQGKRWAPLEDFFNCIKDGRTDVISPAVDSIEVLRILEGAYRSAANWGEPTPII